MSPHSGATLFERALAVLDDPDGVDRTPTIRAFEAIVVLTVATEYWARAIPKWDGLTWQYVVSAVVVTALVPLSLTERWRREAFGTIAAIQAYVAWREFPEASNHSYLGIVICVLAALVDVRRAEERVLFLRAMRWVVCVVLFFSGVQKLAHGYWIGGQYLAFSLSNETYRKVLGGLLSDSELTRLTSYDGAAGAGPYLPSAPLLVAGANVVWLLEMVLAALLILPRTRSVAVIACVALMLTIESAAREIFFGLMFLNAVLLFTRRDVHRVLVVPVCVVLVALLLSRLGILPPITFS